MAMWWFEHPFGGNTTRYPPVHPGTTMKTRMEVFSLSQAMTSRRIETRTTSRTATTTMVHLRQTLEMSGSRMTAPAAGVKQMTKLGKVRTTAARDMTRHQDTTHHQVIMEEATETTSPNFKPKATAATTVMARKTTETQIMGTRTDRNPTPTTTTTTIIRLPDRKHHQRRQHPPHQLLQHRQLTRALLLHRRRNSPHHHIKNLHRHVPSLRHQRHRLRPRPHRFLRAVRVGSCQDPAH